MCLCTWKNVPFTENHIPKQTFFLRFSNFKISDFYQIVCRIWLFTLFLNFFFWGGGVNVLLEYVLLMHMKTSSLMAKCRKVYYPFVFEQGGSFIVPHLMWHRASVLNDVFCLFVCLGFFAVFSEWPSQFSRLLRQAGCKEDLFLTRVPMVCSDK